MASQEPKSFLYAWLGTHKVGMPNYAVSQQGRMFQCELRVDGRDYVAMGRSGNKKDAQTNAAMDFLQYLVRNNEMAERELPSFNTFSLEATSMTTSASANNLQQNMQPQSYHSGPGNSGPALPQQQNELQHHQTDRIKQIAEDVAKSESVDILAEIHGGWTIQNSKQALNEYLQKCRLPAACFRTQKRDADFGDTTVSEIQIYLPSVRQTISARGSGSNKKIAEAACAMSFMRQLYHLGLAAGFKGDRKKTSATNLPSIPIIIPNELSTRITNFLKKVGIEPVAVDVNTATAEEPISLLTSVKLDSFTDAEAPSSSRSVSWAPPLPNWNPWTNCNIDEPPLAFMKLSEISEKLTSFETNKIENKMIQEQRGCLPVLQYRDRILTTISNNRVTLIKGDTGCGKSTQVVQFLLDSYIESGRGADFSAVVSQPRRISAMSLADRVASERGENVGNTVGYGVRFDTVHPRPYGSIFFCTVGTLLRRMENGLRGVSHVIIDEIHERSLDTDFVLIVLRDMARSYPNLRIILMSATINTELFTEYFKEFNCPIIEMHGRAHAVEPFFIEDIIPAIGYGGPPPSFRKELGLDDDEGEEKAKNLNLNPETEDENIRDVMSRMNEKEIPFDLIEALLVDIAHKGQDGAVLIFLPGWSEIQNLQNQLMNNPQLADPNNYQILPLHSQLPPDEQRKVFQHYGGARKIILSTNIAETSITIDDVVFVIDSCRVREMMYTTTNNMVHFATVWASKTSLIQRRGRAGRVRPGFCFHLCSKKRFEALEQHSSAEMLRVPLYNVALTIKLLRLGNISEVLDKAIEKPPVDMVIESITVLRHLEALDNIQELTPLGQILARLPIHPVIGQTLVTATALGIGSLMVQVAAASSFSSPFVPLIKQHQRLNGRHRSFAGERFSDHVALVTVNQRFMEASEEGQQAEMGFCEQNSLSRSILNTTRGAYRQLLDVLNGQCGFPREMLLPISVNTQGHDSNLDLLTLLLIPAFYPNIAYNKGKRQVYLLEQTKGLINKMSILTPPKDAPVDFPSPLMVFKEKVRTHCVSCKELTIISAVQLLLLGSRRVECLGPNFIRIDDMIPVSIKADVAASIVALRPYMHALMIRACKSPENVDQPNEDDREFREILSELASMGLYSVADQTDYLLTDKAQMPPVSFNNSRGNSYEFGGFTNRGRGRGGGSNNQWGFGPNFSSSGRGRGWGGPPPSNRYRGSWNSGSNSYSNNSQAPGSGFGNNPGSGSRGRGGGKWLVPPRGRGYGRPYSYHGHH